MNSSPCATRHPTCIMGTCVVPWDEKGEFIESLFVDQVRASLRLTPHLYIFGTAGEGHAVSDSQFQRVAQVFHETMRAAGAEAMVGVITLSLATMIERIAWCRELGVRKFQVSLPSWGELSDAEARIFFREVCARFPDCDFMHYNLMRAKRLITPEQYGSLAAEHPNLVATKNSTDSITRLRGLQQHAPQLQHFFNEDGYAYASQIGQCSLLASITTNHAMCRAFFDAGQRRDVALLHELNGEITQLIAALIRAAGPGCRIDGAYDKMLAKLQDARFPLRLLPPYETASDDGFRQFAEAVRAQTPRWLPALP
jgi:dihydrodipicolinate synthase/N-acetylneuraminate lyase